jgi:hypothetical protein
VCRRAGAGLAFISAKVRFSGLPSGNGFSDSRRRGDAEGWVTVNAEAARSAYRVDFTG